MHSSKSLFNVKRHLAGCGLQERTGFRDLPHEIEPLLAKYCELHASTQAQEGMSKPCD